MQALPSIDPVLAIAREAGDSVRQMQPHVTMGIKHDGSIITEADISAHQMIVANLQKLNPDIPIISEEQPEEQNLKILSDTKTHLYWLMDPLDNTANYVNGGGDYSVNIALMEEGVPLLGVLYFPARGELYFTGDDGRAYRQVGDAQPEIITVAPLDANRVRATAAVSPNATPTHIPNSTHVLKQIFTRGQGRACLVACGKATFSSEQEGFRIWDSAATSAIIHAAGGTMITDDGLPLFPNLSDDPLILPAYFVGHDGTLPQLRPIDETSDRIVTHKGNAS